MVADVRRVRIARDGRTEDSGGVRGEVREDFGRRHSGSLAQVGRQVGGDGGGAGVDVGGVVLDQIMAASARSGEDAGCAGGWILIIATGVGRSEADRSE